MSRRLLYSLLCLLIAAVCLCSCKKKEQVIPRGKMAKIYAEMFIADQRIASGGQKLRTAADTSLVYEPIFEKYGYNSDDYRASVAFYIRDANRFARILRQSSAIIESEIKALKKQKALKELLEEAEGKGGLFLPETIYFMTGLQNPAVFGTDSLRFFVDSTGGDFWFDLRQWADTAYYGPQMVLRKDGNVENTDDESEGSGIEPEGQTGGPGIRDTPEKGRKTIDNEQDSSKIRLHDKKHISHN